MTELFKKFIEGHCTTEEEALVQEKLSEPVPSAELLRFLKNHWHEIKSAPSIDNSVLNRIHHSINLMEAEETRIDGQKSLNIFLSWSRMAAAILILFLLSAGGWYAINAGMFQKEVFYKVSSLGGRSSNLELPDGSKVWLNGESSIVYSSRYGTRNRLIRLEGEAFFKVETNKNAPFIVQAEDIEVTALGTSFNVDVYSKEKPAIVTLEEGSIKLTHAGESILLKPGEQATINNNGIELSEVDAQLFTSWHTGNLVFKNEELSVIAQQLGRIYNVDFIFETDDLRNFRYRGSVCFDNSILKALEMLQLSTGIRYEIQGNEILLKK